MKNDRNYFIEPVDLTFNSGLSVQEISNKISTALVIYKQCFKEKFIRLKSKFKSMRTQSQSHG